MEGFALRMTPAFTQRNYRFVADPWLDERARDLLQINDGYQGMGLHLFRSRSLREIFETH